MWSAGRKPSPPLRCKVDVEANTANARKRARNTLHTTKTRSKHYVCTMETPEVDGDGCVSFKEFPVTPY